MSSKLLLLSGTLIIWDLAVKNQENVGPKECVPHHKWVSISYFKKCMESQKSPMKMKVSSGSDASLLQWKCSHFLSLVFKWYIVKAPRCFLFHPTKVLTVKQVNHYSVLRLEDHTLVSCGQKPVVTLPSWDTGVSSGSLQTAEQEEEEKACLCSCAGKCSM